MKKLLAKLKVLNYFKLEIILIFGMIILLVSTTIKSINNGIVDLRKNENQITSVNQNLVIINDNLTKTFLYDDDILKNVILNKDKTIYINEISKSLNIIKNVIDTTIINKDTINQIFNNKMAIIQSVNSLKIDFNIKNFYSIDTIQSQNITYITKWFKKYKNVKVRKKKYKKLNKEFLKEYFETCNENNKSYVDYITKNTETNIEIKNLILDHNDKLLEKNKIIIVNLLKNSNERYYSLIDKIIIYSSLILILLYLLIYDIRKIIRNDNRKESTIQDMIYYFKNKN